MFSWLPNLTRSQCFGPSRCLSKYLSIVCTACVFPSERYWENIPLLHSIWFSVPDTPASGLSWVLYLLIIIFLLDISHSLLSTRKVLDDRKPLDVHRTRRIWRKRYVKEAAHRQEISRNSDFPLIAILNLPHQGVLSLVLRVRGWVSAIDLSW